MNTRIRLSAIIYIALTVGSGEAAGFVSDCYTELGRSPTVDATTIDIEQLVHGIDGNLDGAPQWPEARQIDTACKAPTAFPGEFDQFTTPSIVRPAKPVSRVRLDEFSGVVFVYMSQGTEETMTGLAAAIVEYGPDGTPGRVYKASEFLRDEGWARLTTSTFTATSIERCYQQIEYFAYSPEGDIVEELESPIRTPRFCELVILLPTR